MHFKQAKCYHYLSRNKSRFSIHREYCFCRPALVFNLRHDQSFALYKSAILVLDSVFKLTVNNNYINFVLTFNKRLFLRNKDQNIQRFTPQYIKNPMSCDPHFISYMEPNIKILPNTKINWQVDYSFNGRNFYSSGLVSNWS